MIDDELVKADDLFLGEEGVGFSNEEHVLSFR